MRVHKGFLERRKADRKALVDLTNLGVLTVGLKLVEDADTFPDDLQGQINKIDVWPAGPSGDPEVIRVPDELQPRIQALVLRFHVAEERVVHAAMLAGAAWFLQREGDKR